MRARGFTLVELITVMVLIGVLAVVALPRLFDRRDFDARGFFDQSKATLRYAQKAAIAQRRTVCVAFAANGVALTMAGAANSAACDTALILPFQPVAGAGLNASVAGFQFTSLGGTDQAADVTATVAGATGTITVDRVTGYVR